MTVGTLHWVISGRLSRSERLVAYASSLVAACCLLTLYLPVGQRAPSSFLEWFMVVFLWVGSAAGAYLVWRNSRTGVPTAANAIAAMQVVYVVVAVYCLVGFRPWQVGAYLVAVTTLVYVTQVVAVSVAPTGCRVTQVSNSMTSR